MSSQIFSTTAWFEDDKGPYRLTETSDLLPNFLIEVCVDAVALNKSLQISLLWTTCHEKGNSFKNTVLFDFDPSHCFDVLVSWLVAMPSSAG